MKATTLPCFKKTYPPKALKDKTNSIPFAITKSQLKTSTCRTLKNIKSIEIA